MLVVQGKLVATEEQVSSGGRRFYNHLIVSEYGNKLEVLRVSHTEPLAAAFWACGGICAIGFVGASGVMFRLLDDKPVSIEVSAKDESAIDPFAEGAEA